MIVLTNTSGELLEMISARIRVRDLDRVRDRLLATGDVRIEEDDPRCLVWEGGEISAANLAEMEDNLRAQGLDPAPDDGPRRWVFGHAHVEGDVLVVEVNSQARLDRFLGMLEDAEADPRVESAETRPALQPPAVQRAIAWLHPIESLPQVTVPAGDELRRDAETSTVLMRIRRFLELLGEKTTTACDPRTPFRTSERDETIVPPTPGHRTVPPGPSRCPDWGRRRPRRGGDLSIGWTRSRLLAFRR